MIEIRFHGRGGQGAVTAATLLAKAAGYDNKHSQAFPAFGPERRGAPVKAFCRIDKLPITIRSHIYNPDYIVVLDGSLMDLPEIKEGKKEDTVFVINAEESKISNSHTFDATKLAMNVLGKPIVNTAILGAFVKFTKMVTLESVLKALEDVFDGKLLESNKQLVKEAYEGAGNGK